jgi:HAD superfamily hydrolase (TIGR01509 family)
LAEIGRRLKRRHRLPGRADSIAAELFGLQRRAYAGVAPHRSAQGALSSLRSCGNRLMLVTSARRSLVDGFLKRQGWTRQFEGIVTGDDVSRAKPAPDIYLRALRESGARFFDPVVVEDSVHGVVSAKRAGLRVIAVAGRGRSRALRRAGADWIVGSLSRICGVVNKIQAQAKIVHVGSVRLGLKRGAARPSLKGAALLNFESLNLRGGRAVVSGNFVPYKKYLAQRGARRRGPLRPVGVSGLIVLKDRGRPSVVFARRSRNVTQYPGFWELVPSGGIDGAFVGQNGTIDYAAQLLSEFREETGLPGSAVQSVRGFALLWDGADCVFDVGCEIKVNLGADKMRRIFKRSAEYGAPVIVGFHRLAAFMKARAGRMVPTSPALIQAYLESRR